MRSRLLLFTGYVFLLCSLGLITSTVQADPLPRSRWFTYAGMGTPLWRHVGGQSLAPWQQPTLVQIVGVGYTIHPPWLEVRMAGLFGQRLDQSGNSAGFLASINLSIRPANVGVAAIVLNTAATGTNIGMAVTFGVGIPITKNGLTLGLGSQIATYPGLGWPITLVLAPSLSYRFP